MAEPETFVFCPRCGERLDAETRGRPACGACGYVQWADPKVAAGVVVEQAGGILLVRRNHEPMYGRWSFPAGFVDAGERVEDAAMREVREETGVEVRIERLLGVYSGGGDAVVFVAYAGVVTDGVPQAGEEAMAVRFFESGALPEFAFPHDAAILRAWRAGRPQGG